MNIYAVYFSPTGSTEKITKLLASEFGTCTEIDLCLESSGTEYSFAEDDLCIIGVPSYGGRVPAIALERMSRFQGNSASAVLVTVYGNRVYDDTLTELQDFLFRRNFRFAAAIAAVAEHSIMHQFAAGRPDASDQNELLAYAKTIRDALADGRVFAKLLLPGNHPYREYHGIPLKPQVTKNCTGCGICADSCPVGAIPPSAPNTTDTQKCISCMRCLSICPSDARKLNGVMLKLAAVKMKKDCLTPKKNELFMEE